MRLIFNTENKDTELPGAKTNGEKRALSAKEVVLDSVPLRMRPLIEKALDFGLEDNALEEIRFRVGRGVQLISGAGEGMFFSSAPFTAEEARRMLGRICDNSVYAKENELIRGFVSLPFGVRVGLGGAPIAEDGRIVKFTRVTGFCFRIPHEVMGCAQRFMGEFTDGARPVSTLIAAPPGAGKTTLLRDIARCISNGTGLPRPFKVAVADERSELSGGVDGEMRLDLGQRTDLIAGIKKAVSIPMLVRTMSPDVIVTDEVDGEEELKAVSEAVKYGVAVFASVHAGSARELLLKPGLGGAVKDGLMRAFILSRAKNELSLERVTEEENDKAYSACDDCCCFPGAGRGA